MESIILPEPQKKGGMPLLETLSLRRTTRNITSKEIPLQVLSNLLWAAFGVNSEKASFKKSGRTAPSASNSQEIDLYIALKDGLYVYEAIPHQLTLIAEGDFRVSSGRGYATDLIKDTPVNIFYIVDLERYDLGPDQPDPHIGDPEVQKSYYYTDTGFIAQNINLFAASEGLATWFHNCDRERVKADFKLHSNQRILFTQTIGYPL